MCVFWVKENAVVDHLLMTEAYTAFGMILDGKVLDMQLGAFLMLLRAMQENQ